MDLNQLYFDHQILLMRAEESPVAGAAVGHRRDAAQLAQPPAPLDVVSEDRAAIRREYVTSIVRRRLHQQAFRARVIEAYLGRGLKQRPKHRSAEAT